MKKHFLLLALAAICSLSVFGQTVTAGWDGYSKNNLPSNGNVVDNTITLSTNLSTGGYSLGGRSTNAYNYEYANSDNYIDITTPDNMEITSVTAYIIYLGDNNSIAIQFCSESPFSSADLGSETLTGSTIQSQESPCSPTIPSGTRSARIHRANTGWGPYLYAVSVTAEPAAAPVGPVDPNVKLKDGTYYLGTSGLDLSTLFSSKNKESAVTYQIKSAGSTGATLNGSILTATAAGTVTVTASQPAVDGKYLAGSADATITVKEHDYATSANFMDIMNTLHPYSGKYDDVADELNNHHYIADNASQMYYDQQNASGGDDEGLGWDGTHSLSFWVKANQKVSFTVARISTSPATLALYDINGNSFETIDIYGNTTTIRTTSKITEFRFTTPSTGWFRIHNIAIDPAPYHVYFDANGGSGEMAAWEKATGKPYNLPNCTFTAPANMSFAGWKMQGGTDEVYEVGAEFTMGSADVTFVAQWAQNLDDPEITFDNATYKVGETTLDLSSLFNSKSTGAVTYSIKSDDGASAAITGTMFTAQHTGSVVVTASQARVEGEYNAGSKDATITVIAFAEGTDFVALANQGSRIEGSVVASKLQEYNYSISETSGIVLDPGNTDDAGFGIEADPRTLSFWVKDNQKVTIKVGKLNGKSSGKTATIAQYNLSGVQITSGTISANETKEFTTTQITEFRFTTNSGDWSRVQQINIEALTYTITFNQGEGGQGEMAAGAEFAGKTYSLPDCEFTHTGGKVFDGWKYSEDEQIYAEKATITMPAKNIFFTAQWKTPEVVPHSVTYSAGEGGAWTGDEPTEGDHTEGQLFTLPASSVVASTGYQFAGWNDGTQTYAAEASYRMPNDNVTLTAQWNKLYTVTYAAGCEDYTGTLPTQEPQINGAKFTVAAAGIKRQGYAFRGWNDTYNTYQPGVEYTMPSSNLVFTAQWEAVTVPTVTDLTITEPVNEIVPLSWNIPGLVDMRKATAPYQAETNATDKNPTIVHQQDGSVTTTFTLQQYGNSGVGFPIPSGVVDKVSFEYKVTLPSSACWMWGGAGYADGSVNWQGQGAGQMSGDKADWTPAQCTMGAQFWASAKHSTADNQVAIYMNSDGSYSNQSFSVRNVRYHATGMSDVEIAKVTLVRKAGEASTSPTDGVVLINQQAAFDYTDKDAKEAGTYYYTVFAYDAEGNYSAAVTTEYVLEVKQTYTVTYAKGGEDVMGEVPVDEMPKVEGTKFNLPTPGSLQKPYCQFNGWSDGTDTYTAGQEYTMPANNVTFTAQWGAEEQGLRIPENTVRLNYANQSTSTPTASFADETCLDLYSIKTVVWDVYIIPGQYTLNYKYGCPYYGAAFTVSIIDPASQTVCFSLTGGFDNPGSVQTIKDEKTECDLSALIKGKLYQVKVENTWDGSSLRLAHIDFIPTITIDQTKDDNLIFNGKANVTLIRPLVGDMTNSICLPFALNREQINSAFGTDAKVWALSSSELSANNMTLDIEFDQVNAIEAGKPYLIQPGEGYNPATNPVFNEIEMSTALNPVEQDNLDFIGTVQKSFVSVGFKDHLFVGPGNEVFYPDGSDYLSGMRAYFKIKYHPEAPVTEGVQARMILGRTTPTELQTIKANDSVRKVMVNGRIHIIRDGVINDILGNTIK